MKDRFFIEPDGCSLAYQYYPAEAAKPTLVFLHGLGGDLSIWQPLVPFFTAKSYPCLLIDLRGFGFSGRQFPSKPVTLDTYAADVDRLISFLHPVHPPICVGHCFGGNVGIRLAARIPLTALVLLAVGPNIKLQDPVRSSILTLWENVIRLATPCFPHCPPPDRQNFAHGRRQHDIDFVRIVNDIAAANPHSYLKAWTALKAESDSTFRSLSLPIVGIHGKRDQLIPFHRIEPLYRHHPTAKLTGICQNHLIPQNIPPADLAAQIMALINLFTLFS